MNTFSRIAVTATTLALFGCATGYQSSDNPLTGMFGGYWDEKGPGQLIKVGFDGNGYISNDKVATYLLYRCAEVAAREGSDYFILYQNLPAAVADRRSTERTVGTVGGKASSYAYILLSNAPGDGVMSSAEVMQRLEPVVKSTGGKS